MNGNGRIGSFAILAFCAWGFWKGWKFITGRNEWLDRREPASIIVKCLVCIVLSWLFGAIAIIQAVLTVLHWTTSV